MSKERTTKKAAGASVVVTVSNPRFKHPPVTLSPPDEFEFGRTKGGAARISEDEAVSRHHGTIIATEIGFSIVTTGSQIGVTVADRTTPSRLVIPRRVGPVPVPFRDCSVIVELDDDRDYLDVTVTGSSLANAWADAWGPQMRAQWHDRAPRTGIATRRFMGRSSVKWLKSNGQPYAWFRTLAALCEPALGAAPAGTPTNEQICRRLHQSKSVTERHLTQIYAAFRLDDAARDRELVVARAIRLGIVTRDDVDAL